MDIKRLPHFELVGERMERDLFEGLEGKLGTSVNLCVFDHVVELVVEMHGVVVKNMPAKFYKDQW